MDKVFITYDEYEKMFGRKIPDYELACNMCVYRNVSDTCPDCRGGLWIPKATYLPEDTEENEQDKKKADITKVTPGQMMEDFNLALLAVSEVTRYGIEKYQRPSSWKHAHKELMKYKDAQGRHLLKQPTEMYDDESGYLHLIHQVWNGLALLQMMLEFDKVKPRDAEKMTKTLPGITTKEPEWFKGGK